MNILLISTNRHDLPYPVMPFGACMIAQAAENAGHAVQMLDLMFEKHPSGALQDLLRATRFDLVALSIRNIDNNDVIRPLFFLEPIPGLVQTIRCECESPVVIGGAAVNVMPEEILRFTGADYALPGDGRQLFPAFLKHFAEGKTSQAPGLMSIKNGIVFRNAALALPRTLPCTVPDLSRWIEVDAYLARMSAVPLQTKMGCRFECVYCTYRRLEGHQYRLASPKLVARAVSELGLQGHRHVEFVDNVFNSPYEHALEICHLLGRTSHGVRLQSLEINPHFLSDKLVEAMEHAGFVAMGLTVESACNAVLSGLGKSFSLREVNQAAEILRRHHLPCCWIFLLGGPGETRDSVKRTFDFASKLVRRHDAVFFNVGVRVYPRTAMEKIARDQGVALNATANMLAPVFYVSPQVSLSWLTEQTAKYTRNHLNTIDSNVLDLSFLSRLQKAARWVGVQPPLWRYTCLIRKVLKRTGIHG